MNSDKNDFQKAQDLCRQKRHREALDLLLELWDGAMRDCRTTRSIIADWISVCYRWLGEKEQAKRFALRAVEVAISEAEEHFYHGVYLYRDEADYKRSLTVFKMLISKYSTDFDRGELEFWCGVNCNALRQFERSRTWLAKAYHSLNRKDTDPVVWAVMLAHYAYALLMLDRLGEAERIYKEADSHVHLLGAAERAEFHLMRSTLYRELANHDLAISDAREALRIALSEGNCPEGLLARMRIEVASNLVSLGQYDDALAQLGEIGESRTHQRTRFRYLSIKATAHYHHYQFVEAIPALRDIVSTEWPVDLIRDNDVVYRLMLAVCLREAGEMASANAMYDQLMRDPDVKPVDKAALRDRFDQKGRR